MMELDAAALTFLFALLVIFLWEPVSAIIDWWRHEKH